MKILVNGKIWENEPIKSVYQSQAFNFGFSLFETIKVLKNKPIFLEEHICRINKSLEYLGESFRLDINEAKKDSLEIIKVNEFEEGALKILLAKTAENFDKIMSLRETRYDEKTYSQGFKITKSEVKRNERSYIVKLKTANYLENILVKNKAVSEGFDDCYFLNTKEKLAETSIANIFFIKNNKIYTPDLESGILNGIIRNKVFDIAYKLKMDIIEGEFDEKEFLSSEEIFLTNSLMGIMPVSKIDEMNFRINKTLKIKEEYDKLLNEEI